MKNPRIMLALLAASALGLTVSAIAHAQDSAGGDGSQEAAETTETGRQRRNERRQADRSEPWERSQREATDREDSATADARRADRNRRSMDQRGGDDERPNYRRTEGRQSEDRQARHDRREAGQNARWRDQRNHREFNRRDFGHTRGERRRVAGEGQRYGERHHTKHRAFDRRVDRRLANQRARTRTGWKSGEITHRELKRIRKDQRKIARMDRRFGGDGRYTKRERRKLNSALDRASQRVYRVKNDRRVVDNGRARKHRR